MNNRKKLSDVVRSAVGEHGFDRVTPQDIPRIRVIPLSEIDCDPNQPRKEFDEEELRSLARSIDEYGQLSPVLVQRQGRDRYLLVAGERRLRAHRILERDDIQAVVINGNAKVISVIENSQRANLLPIEEAEAYLALVEELNFTQEEAAAVVGTKRSTFAEILRINDLPPHIKEECRTSDTPKSTLIQIARIQDVDDQHRLWNEAKSGATVQATKAGRRQGRAPDPNVAYKTRISTARRLMTLLGNAEAPIELIKNDGHYNDLAALRNQLNEALEAYEKREQSSA